MIHQLTDKKSKLIFLIIFFLFLNSINFKEKNFIFGNIEEINVVGLDYHLNNAIKNKLKYLENEKIFSIDKEILFNQLNNYKYIENFKVLKIYPDNLLLTLKQTTFLAFTLKEHKQYLIGSNGKLIDYELFSETSNLPVIYGNFKPDDFIILKDKINESPIEFDNIKSFFFYPSLRWDIQNNNNITIKLPNKDIDNALILAKKIIDSKNLEGNTIDLRINNQIILSNE